MRELRKSNRDKVGVAIAVNTIEIWLDKLTGRVDLIIYQRKGFGLFQELKLKIPIFRHESLI